MLGFSTKLGFALVVVLVAVSFSFVVSDELSESFFNFEFTSSFKCSRSYTELSSFILSHDLKCAATIMVGYWDIVTFGDWDIGILEYWDIEILEYWDIRILGHWNIYSPWVGANPAALSALTHFVDRQLQRWMLYCFPPKSQ